FHRLTGPGPFVEAPPVHLDRRDHRRDLGDRAQEPGQHRLQALPVQVGHGPAVGLGAGGVEGVGGHAEGDLAPVDLAGLGEEAQEAGGPAEADEEDTGGVGVERPGVADPAQAVDAAQDTAASVAWRRKSINPSVSSKVTSWSASSASVTAAQMNFLSWTISARLRMVPTRRR